MGVKLFLKIIKLANEFDKLNLVWFGVYTVNKKFEKKWLYKKKN